MDSLPHQFYNDYSLPCAFYGYPTPEMAGENGYGSVFGGAMWGATCEENLVPFCNVSSAAVNFDVVSPESDISSSVMAASFPELLKISEDLSVPAAAAFSDYGNMGLHGLAGINQNFGGEISQPYMCDQFGEECCTGLNMSDIKPFGLAGQENWGIQGNQQVPTIDQDQSNMKVGRYSEEERKERIGRYLKKRNQRNFNKTIKYACRKTLADRRVRVRGRFARNTELSDQEIEAKKIDSNHTCKDQRSEMYCSNDAVQMMKYDEDDYWLQEAMGLMYLPYATS
ncbi:hypothetical protein GBA52_013494 [Prunus armeniaca]|nr:hypothetical protein GBA52_013494 [Prunus armeniaca]